MNFIGHQYPCIYYPIGKDLQLHVGLFIDISAARVSRFDCRGCGQNDAYDLYIIAGKAVTANTVIQVTGKPYPCPFARIELKSPSGFFTSSIRDYRIAMSSSKVHKRLSSISGQIKRPDTAATMDLNIPFEADRDTFPKLEELPKIPGAPPGAAWVWGPEDGLGRLNLLTPKRVKCLSFTTTSSCSSSTRLQSQKCSQQDSIQIEARKSSFTCYDSYWQGL